MGASDLRDARSRLRTTGVGVVGMKFGLAVGIGAEVVAMRVWDARS